MNMLWRWRVTSRSLRRWTARARQGWRRTVTGVLGGTAVVLVVIGARYHAAETQHQWMAAALPFAVAAVGLRVWRATEEGLPDALRWRTRSRRIALRIGSLGWFGASICLLAYLDGHGVRAHDAGVAALWALALAPVPVLVEGSLWRLAPRELRRQVRTGQLGEAVRDLNANAAQRYPVAFDPDHGYAGTPVPRQSADPAAHVGPPCEARPTERRAQAMLGLSYLNRSQRIWLREATLRWDGTTLTVIDGRRTIVPVPLQRTGPTAPAPRGPWTDRPVELMLVREQGLGEPGWQARILLLDASGRRLLTMPGLGFLDDEVAAVAQAAGLRHSVHRWAETPYELPWRRLWARAYPRHRGHLRLRLGHRI